MGHPGHADPIRITADRRIGLARHNPQRTDLLAAYLLGVDRYPEPVRRGASSAGSRDHALFGLFPHFQTDRPVRGLVHLASFRKKGILYLLAEFMLI